MGENRKDFWNGVDRRIGSGRRRSDGEEYCDAHHTMVRKNITCFTHIKDDVVELKKDMEEVKNIVSSSSKSAVPRWVMFMLIGIIASIISTMWIRQETLSKNLIDNQLIMQGNQMKLEYAVKSEIRDIRSDIKGFHNETSIPSRSKTHPSPD